MTDSLGSPAIFSPGQAELSDAQLALLASVGVIRTVEVGDVLFQSGDEIFDFVAIIDAQVDVIGGSPGGEEVLIVRHGPKDFAGEINMLSDARSILSARVSGAGRVITVPRPDLHHLLAAEPELADVIVGAFIDRRRMLREGEG